ncbi:uncharacterized protein CTRU02_206710 [Colletotrichum truncatum]|uniref:Uncharacterized protein n=1 Tax=Colletotrichum truncatum TaxID=5467 RepID=A0ACC3Z7R8_COLTU|nr:uncharacterized protein CTRU02_14132 [Colletotrichum truncatum]KAF6782485.1 hypothetical protein CTRU02_14132 [Colletotrichum truncatum]
MATTLTPFLYQTRTILRASAAVRAFSATAGQLHRPPREQPIPFEWEGSIEEERPDIPSGRDGGVRSTITPTERHVFRKIFDDLAKRNPTLAQPSSLSSDNADAADAPETGSRDAILSKYPPSLRRAAEAALGMREVSDDHPERPFASRIAFKREEMEPDQVDAETQDIHDELRTLEAIKLQQLLDVCNTDVEVWDVLEQEVFSMVEKLGIAQGKPQEGKKKAKIERQAPSLNMDSHGPVYSMHLLKALRTLDQNFTQSSPLALNVLPRVKELGLASYVLGVSTPFYNELASILWYRHGDTQAVLAVLDEMQYAGLFYDKQTLRLIDTIELALDSFRDRQLGVFSKAVGTIPGYNLDVKANVARYARRVRHAIRQQRTAARY